MSDNSDLLFREVDEDVRRDQLIALWKRYGVYLVSAVVALVLIVVGYQFYDSRRDAALKAQSDRYKALTESIEALTPSEAAERLAAAAGDFSGGYRQLAGLQEAAALAKAGDHAAAAAAYDRVAAAARDRRVSAFAAWLAASERYAAGDSDGALAALAALSASGEPLARSATEMMGAIYLALEDIEAARAMFQSLAEDAATPPAMRARAGDVLALLSDGDAPGKEADAAPSPADEVQP